MRVLAFMKYGALAASARQRLLQFTPYLGEHGVTVEAVPLLDDDYMSQLARGEPAPRTSILAAYARRLAQVATRTDHDLVWVQYELFPYLPGVFERLAARSGRPVVVDYDDAIFHQYDAHASPWVRRALGRKLVPLLRSAAACICGNDYLRAYVRQHNAACTVIPTVVDTDRYLPATDLVRSGPPVIGWIGSPSTFAYVEPLLPTLRAFVDRGDAHVRVVGGGRSAERHPWLTAIPWSESSEIAEIQRMDVGVMPVPDDVWARGKCGYKLIQYMACGLPVIASPVGVNTSIVTEGENGLLATTHEQWSAGLARLLADAGLRRQLGEQGRSRTVARYSLASQQPRLLEVLRTAAQRGGAG